MLAFIQNQVVDQLHLLSPQEFLDGLALGQLTPGPVLMLAAFVGYKLAGVVGAAVTVPYLQDSPSRRPSSRCRRGAMPQCKDLPPSIYGVSAYSSSRWAP